MYYDKRIRYLSYYESGIKLQNAGYVKFQVRDSLCQMVIYVKGPRLMGSGDAKVYLLSEKEGKKEEDGPYSENRKNNMQKHLLGNLTIRGGQGYCAVRLNAESMGDCGLRYDEVCGIRIELQEYQYLESRWSVVNFMPGRHSGPADNKAGYRLRRPQDGGSAGKNRQPDKKETEAEEVPVEVSLIVTPVSENARVEKIVKEETAPAPEEFEVIEMPMTGRAGNSAGGPADSTASAEQPAGGAEEETSMQEMLEREVLREEAEAAQTAQMERSTQPGQAEQTAQTMQEERSKRPYLMEEPRQVPEEEILQEMEECGGSESAEEIPEDTGEIPLPEQELQADKWEQLRKTYPVVHPIREEEEYLKIAPKDFVIFTEKYQELVHNSFLLHGYYNYKHLILGKKEKDGHAVYYLGVPGTFHEREKTVAVMFGFEAFDGKREPAENGDFGYYLRKVEI